MSDSNQVVAECTVCDHARIHGWDGLKHGTHCRGCHRTWTGLKELHCTRCHQHFASEAGADAHQPRGIRCRKPPSERFQIEMRRSGPVWVRKAQRTLPVGKTLTHPLSRKSPKTRRRRKQSGGSLPQQLEMEVA